jgi:hypothetical protein
MSRPAGGQTVRHDLVVIGGSAGAHTALRTVLARPTGPSRLPMWTTAYAAFLPT